VHPCVHRVRYAFACVFFSSVFRVNGAKVRKGLCVACVEFINSYNRILSEKVPKRLAETIRGYILSTVYI